MGQNVQFIGFTYDEARRFIASIVTECLERNIPQNNNPTEVPLNVREACKLIGISAPTLRKFVKMSLIRRHDLGPRKKVFYRSELEEDIKKLKRN